jgi:dihydroorotase
VEELMKKLLIKNGRVIDPANQIDNTLDVLIENGKIAQIDKKITDNKADIIDATRLIVAPGFIDMHVHLREPGREDKETIKTGSWAAAAGGFTSIACMPNTNPVNDNESVTEFILNQAKKEAVVNIFPIAAVTKGSKGEELSEIGGLKQAGAVALSDDGLPVSNSRIMRRILEYSKMFNLVIINHCEDLNLANEGVMHEGYYSTFLGLRGIPAVSEEVMVARDLILTDLTGGNYHIAHLSTKGSLELLIQAKKKKLNATAEITPHHFTLTDGNLTNYDTNYKMKPPLRSKEDVKALIKGIKDGYIDVIATDHAPHLYDEKNVEFDYAPFGIIGLETAVPLILDKLFFKEKIDLNRIISMLTINPARILRIDRGTLSIGAKADITILNLNKIHTINADQFFSKSRNTPFNGMKLKGSVEMTLVNGKLVWNAKELKLTAK